MGPGLGLLMAASAALAALALVAYWALVLSEGAYLGQRTVTWLYDRAASSYDRIKNSDAADDRRYLARPLLMALDAVEAPRVLDVATGTGRLPLALLAERDFCGDVLALDRSAGMLARARARLEAFLPLGEARCRLMRADAAHLPLHDGAFDAVVCLEALEFTANPRRSAQELLRVLKPGGVLLVSNRVGLDALWYPGKHCGRGRLEALLRSLGARPVERESWQVYYDLVWARKGSHEDLSLRV